MRKIKRVSSIFLLLCVIGMCISIPDKVNAAIGSGTERDPYLISNADELVQIQEDRDAYYRLTSNLEVNAWSGQFFSGVLDGDGYKISIGTIQNGFIYSNSGTLKNLSLEIRSDTANPCAFVRENHGIIENVHISGRIRATSGNAWAGTVAVINAADGVIRNTYSTADVSFGGSSGANLRFGAFVGVNHGTIEHGYWRGSTYKVEDFVSENDGTITGCVLGGDYGKSDAEMRRPETYVGWDFDTVWKMDADMNDGFPCHINEREFIKIPVEGIALDAERIFIEPGQTATLTADVSPAEAWNRQVVWESSDPSVASVSADGTVTAHEIGDTVITATTEDGGFHDECRVSVVIKTTGLTLDRHEVLVDAGECFTLCASITPENATDQTIHWSSSDHTVATVDGGTVQCLTPGRAVITAASEDGGGTDTCVVTVRPPASERYDVNGDGVCTIEDGQWLARYLSGDDRTGLTAERADVNGDGKANSRDVTDLLQYLNTQAEG